MSPNPSSCWCHEAMKFHVINMLAIDNSKESLGGELHQSQEESFTQFVFGCTTFNGNSRTHRFVLLLRNAFLHPWWILCLRFLAPFIVGMHGCPHEEDTILALTVSDFLRG